MLKALHPFQNHYHLTYPPLFQQLCASLLMMFSNGESVQRFGCRLNTTYSRSRHFSIRRPEKLTTWFFLLKNGLLLFLDRCGWRRQNILYMYPPEQNYRKCLCSGTLSTTLNMYTDGSQKLAPLLCYAFRPGLKRLRTKRWNEI